MAIIGLIRIINDLAYLYSICLVVYALLSWFPGGYESAIGRFLARICEPYIGFFDRLNLRIGSISFSIIAAIFVLNLVVGGLTKLLTNVFIL